MKQPDNQTESKPESRGKPTDGEKDLYRILFVFYFVISGALVIAAAGAGSLAGIFTSLIWAVACLAVGAFAGFLFGIPKTRQSDGPRERNAHGGDSRSKAEERTYQSLVNTNLMEISDWLTKIIVGLGLINLKSLPEWILKAAQLLADSLSIFEQSGRFVAFAAALIVAFTVLGFLFGYLFTRLYLASAFVRADLGGQSQTRETAEAASASVESLRDAFGVLKAEVSQKFEPTSPQNRESVEPRPSTVVTTSLAPDYEAALIGLAREYNSFSANTREERVQARDELAGRMAAIINSNSGARAWATQLALGETNVGLVAGIATAMNAVPQSGDPDKIFSLAPLVSFKHARYRVATAIGRLFESGVASAVHVPAAKKILTFYANDRSDESLRRRISHTIAQISKSTGISWEMDIQES